MTADRIYKLALTQLNGLTVHHCNEVTERFGSAEAFFKASESEIAAMTGGCSPLTSREKRDEAIRVAEQEIEYAETHSINIILYDSPAYPTRLLHCDDAPKALFVCGECDLNSAHSISIVGTRHATAYGVNFIERLVERLAIELDDLIIVSGLAYGADITAHLAAIKNGIRTVSVLGHGLSTIYPAAHRQYAADIVRHDGMLLTEYRHDAHIGKANFLARNRIVAGISDCTVVTESGIKGGSLFTARLASEYGREVMALPGRISDPYSAGCNKLIYTNRASLIRDADDLLATMGWTGNSEAKDRAAHEDKTLFTRQLTADEQTIFDHLTQNGQSSTARMSAELKIPVGKLMSLLVELEFKGLILSYPGGKYALA